MAVDTVRISSKGQLVIPQNVREELHIEEGTIFAIMSSHDTIVLKKLPVPQKEELIKSLSDIAKKSKEKLKAKGFTQEDLKIV